MFIEEVVRRVMGITYRHSGHLDGKEAERELTDYLSPLLSPPMPGPSLIYAACSFKWQEDHGKPGDDDYEEAHSLPPVDSYWDRKSDAQDACEKAFQVWAEKEAQRPGGTSLEPDVYVWAPARDSHKGHLCIWALYRSAAAAMGDENREYYPQMRQMSFWIEEIEVGSADRGDRPDRIADLTAGTAGSAELLDVLAAEYEAEDASPQPGRPQDLRTLAEGWASSVGNSLPVVMMRSCGERVLDWLDGRPV
jgi:hypothetical protein